MTEPKVVVEECMQDPEERRAYWEYIEEQMALFKEHFPLSTAEERYNIADKNWDELIKIVVQREREMVDDEDDEDEGDDEGGEEIEQ